MPYLKISFVKMARRNFLTSKLIRYCYRRTSINGMNAYHSKVICNSTYIFKSYFRYILVIKVFRLGYNNILECIIYIKTKIIHSDRDQPVIKISFNHWLMVWHILYKKRFPLKISQWMEIQCNERPTASFKNKRCTWYKSKNVGDIIEEIVFE